MIHAVAVVGAVLLKCIGAAVVILGVVALAILFSYRVRQWFRK